MPTESVCVNGVEMEYYTFGTGKRAFVILPGVDTKSLMTAALAVEAAYRVFAKDYTVYLIDRRKNMPSPYPIRQMAADTAAVMRAVGIRNADVFGASQGGMMAMCLALDSPDLVRKMALGSTTAQADETITAGIDRWITLAKSGDRTALTAEMMGDLFSAGTIEKYHDILLHMNDHVSDRDLERFMIQARAIHGFDILDELSGITCPTLVIGAEGDRLLPACHSRRIAETIGCELYLYGAEYGHCVFDEAPDYKQRLFDFFSRP